MTRLSDCVWFLVAPRRPDLCERLKDLGHRVSRAGSDLQVPPGETAGDCVIGQTCRTNSSLSSLSVPYLLYDRQRRTRQHG